MGRCNVPIVGAINGYALSAGFALALATDLRIAADDARFQVTQIKRELFAGGGIGHLLQAIGNGRALELMCTGRMLEAGEALALGLVLKGVPRDRLLDEAHALAAQIVASPPLGVSASKRVVYLRVDDSIYGKNPRIVHDGKVIAEVRRVWWAAFGPPGDLLLTTAVVPVALPDAYLAVYLLDPRTLEMTFVGGTRATAQFEPRLGPSKDYAVWQPGCTGPRDGVYGAAYLCDRRTKRVTRIDPATDKRAHR